DPPAVETALVDSIEGDGVYLLPSMTDGSDPEARIEAARKGPFAFVSIRAGERGENMMVTSVVQTVAINLIGALLIGLMLAAAAPRLNFCGRVLFVMIGGVFASLVGVLPNYVWWEFPLDFIGLAALDLVVGWFLAGIAMAALIRG
ncbi:MAG: hypothetical protein AAF236_02695, partial [Verrucomicrobiota bacterium]